MRAKTIQISRKDLDDLKNGNRTDLQFTLQDGTNLILKPGGKTTQLI